MIMPGRIWVAGIAIKPFLVLGLWPSGSKAEPLILPVLFLGLSCASVLRADNTLLAALV
jgi:hypothetical protein